MQTTITLPHDETYIDAKLGDAYIAIPATKEGVEKLDQLVAAVKAEARENHNIDISLSKQRLQDNEEEDDGKDDEDDDEEETQQLFPGRVWTDDEEAYVTEKMQEGWSYQEIADTLAERTKHAVQTRVSSENLYPDGWDTTKGGSDQSVLELQPGMDDWPVLAPVTEEDQRQLRDVFQDVIANNGKLTYHNVRGTLDIRHGEKWTGVIWKTFINKCTRNFKDIAEYFDVPNNFRIEEEEGWKYISYKGNGDVQ